mgnify:CR=1 FL=1
MKTHLKHIFFDLDHTLWDFDKNSALTFKKIFGIHDIKINIDEFLEVYEPINLNYWKYYREERVSKKELRYGRLKESFDLVKYKIDDDLINKLSEDYITYLTSYNHLFEGAHDTLQYLMNKYQLHIITNGFGEAQQKKVEKSKIKEFFKTITDSEMVGVKKPNPIIFNYALEQAEAQPQESLMIGDSLEADIEGAQGVGMEVLLFDYKQRHNKTPIQRITHLNAIQSLL